MEKFEIAPQNCFNINIVRTAKAKDKKTAQEIQDEIFRKMSADKKVELGTGLWQLARDLDKNKVIHGTNRPGRSINTDSKNS